MWNYHFKYFKNNGYESITPFSSFTVGPKLTLNAYVGWKKDSFDDLEPSLIRIEWKEADISSTKGENFENSSIILIDSKDDKKIEEKKVNKSKGNEIFRIPQTEGKYEFQYVNDYSMIGKSESFDVTNENITKANEKIESNKEEDFVAELKCLDLIGTGSIVDLEIKLSKDYLVLPVNSWVGFYNLKDGKSNLSLNIEKDENEVNKNYREYSYIKFNEEDFIRTNPGNNINNFL
jgi:hypothetical protein